MLVAKYDKKHEDNRKLTETPEKIVQIAKSKGEFVVSLRYRDDWLRRRCKKLVEQGLLKGGKRRDRVLVFFPASEE